GKLTRPARRQRKDIVGKPDLVRRERRLNAKHLFGHDPRRSRVVVVPVQGLRAPVAAVGTAAARNHVERKISVGACPSLAVRLDVHKIPRWKRQLIEISYRFALWVEPHLAVTVAIGDTGDPRWR